VYVSLSKQHLFPRARMTPTLFRCWRLAGDECDECIAHFFLLFFLYSLHHKMMFISCVIFSDYIFKHSSYVRWNLCICYLTQLSLHLTYLSNIHVLSFFYSKHLQHFSHFLTLNSVHNDNFDAKGCDIISFVSRLCLSQRPQHQQYKTTREMIKCNTKKMVSRYFETWARKCHSEKKTQWIWSCRQTEDRRVDRWNHGN
jgi:hypothetical protein